MWVPHGLEQIVYGSVLTVRVGQILLDQGQITPQDAQVAVAHDLLQGVDVYPGPQAPQREGAPEGVRVAVLNACALAGAQRRSVSKQNERSTSRFVSSCGSGPRSWLSFKQRNAKLASLLSSGGILPLSWSEDRSRYCKLAMLLNSGGMLPLRPLSHRSSPVTCPAWHPTPYQLQGVLVVSQPMLSAQPGPFVLLYSATSA